MTVSSFRRFVPVALVLLALAVCAQARDKIVITAKKKTVEKIKGSEQDLARGKSRATEEQIMYVIEVKNMSPAVPSDVTVEWLVLVEGAGGRVFPGAMGQKNLDLPFGRTETIETEAIALKGREWYSGPLPGSVEDAIAGYGVRVLATDGAVISDKYNPPSVESRIDWNLLSKPRQKGLRLPRRMQRGQ